VSSFEHHKRMVEVAHSGLRFNLFILSLSLCSFVIVGRLTNNLYGRQVSPRTVFLPSGLPTILPSGLPTTLLSGLPT
jgi:hypothetical protein